MKNFLLTMVDTSTTATEIGKLMGYLPYQVHNAKTRKEYDKIKKHWEKMGYEYEEVESD